MTQFKTFFCDLHEVKICKMFIILQWGAQLGPSVWDPHVSHTIPQKIYASFKAQTRELLLDSRTFMVPGT